MASWKNCILSQYVSGSKSNKQTKKQKRFQVDLISFMSQTGQSTFNSFTFEEIVVVIFQKALDVQRDKVLGS